MDILCHANIFGFVLFLFTKADHISLILAIDLDSVWFWL